MSKICVMIAAHGNPDKLSETLRWLAECALPESYGGLWLVENGPKAGLEELAVAAPASLAVNYAYSAPASKSLALNHALSSIEDRDALIFFTDDDVRFSPNVLVEYVTAAEDHGGGYYFGGPVEVLTENLPADWLRPFLPASEIGWSQVEGESSALFLGCNWAAWLSDLRRIGEFDPSFGPGGRSGATGQETDMQLRLWAGGVKPVYLPGAKVTHRIGSESATVRWAMRRRFREGLYKGGSAHGVSATSKAARGGGARPSRWRRPASLRAGYLLPWLSCYGLCALAEIAGICKGRLHRNGVL